MGKIIKLVVMMLLVGNLNAFAQDVEMTPYEKGREELLGKTVEKILGYLDKFDQLRLMVIWATCAKSVDLQWSDYDTAEDFIIKFCDLEDVYPYKTAVKKMLLPLDLSVEFSDYAIQKWKTVGQWYKVERKKLDATKTDIDKQREQIRATKE